MHLIHGFNQYLMNEQFKPEGRFPKFCRMIEEKEFEIKTIPLSEKEEQEYVDYLKIWAFNKDRLEIDKKDSIKRRVEEIIL